MRLMEKTFLLRISTPERQFFSGPVESLILSTITGQMGILPGHLAMVVALTASPIQIKTPDGWKIAAIARGFARIKEDEVTVLTDTAEWPEEIELNRAMEAKKRAEERLQNRLSEVEYMRSRVALERALARLSAKDYKKGGDVNGSVR